MQNQIENLNKLSETVEKAKQLLCLLNPKYRAEVRQLEKERLRQQYKEVFLSATREEREVAYDAVVFWGRRGWGWWFVREEAPWWLEK